METAVGTSGRGPGAAAGAAAGAAGFPVPLSSFLMSAFCSFAFSPRSSSRSSAAFFIARDCAIIM